MWRRRGVRSRRPSSIASPTPTCRRTNTPACVSSQPGQRPGDVARPEPSVRTSPRVLRMQAKMTPNSEQDRTTMRVRSVLDVPRHHIGGVFPKLLSPLVRGGTRQRGPETLHTLWRKISHARANQHELPRARPGLTGRQGSQTSSPRGDEAVVGLSAVHRPPISPHGTAYWVSPVR